MSIEESYTNNILKKLEDFLDKTRKAYYTHPSQEIRNLLDKAEHEFFQYCEKYISLIEEESKK